MPLTRLTFKLTLISALIFAAMIALIRAQPYDDSELREFLTPPDSCPAPCFMGIHPGVTTGEEALQILQNHAWVEEITSVNYQETETGSKISSILWVWSSRSPEFISKNSSANVFVDFRSGFVSHIQMGTSFTIGDVWLALGAPDLYWLTPIGGSMNAAPVNLAFQFFYFRNWWRINGYTGCFYSRKLWQSNTSISITRGVESPPMEGPYSNFGAFASRMYAFQHTFCRR